MKNLKKRSLNQPTVGAYAPLFDRLIDENPYELEDLTPVHVLDLDGLKQSICCEIELLLNTRPTSKRLAMADTDAGGSDYDSPIYFGLNDFSWFDSSQDIALYHIGQKIEDLIKHFEPRLKNPHVGIKNVNRSALGLDIVIGGDVFWNSVRSPLHFPMTVKNLFSK